MQTWSMYVKYNNIGSLRMDRFWKLYYTHRNQKKTRLSILTFGNVFFNAKKIFKDRKGDYNMMKDKSEKT